MFSRWKVLLPWIFWSILGSKLAKLSFTHSCLSFQINETNKQTKKHQKTKRIGGGGGGVQYDPNSYNIEQLICNWRFNFSAPFTKSVIMPSAPAPERHWLISVTFWMAENTSALTFCACCDVFPRLGMLCYDILTPPEIVIPQWHTVPKGVLFCCSMSMGSQPCLYLARRHWFLCSGITPTFCDCFVKSIFNCEHKDSRMPQEAWNR